MSDGAGDPLPPDRTPNRVAALVAALAAVAGFAAVYVTLGRTDNVAVVEASPARVSQQGAPAPARLNAGSMAAFVYKRAPEPLPPIAFMDGEGRSRSLADWRGRFVLLNLWATWCAPCRKEMPELDQLQTELGSERFEVVALAVDRAGTAAVSRFLKQIEVKSLGLYIDPLARASFDLKAVGLPTTLLIDAQGREIGRLTGPADWSSPEAKRLISAALLD